jgi:hypothetical protein
MATPNPDPVRCPHCRRRFEACELRPLLAELVCTLCHMAAVRRLKQTEGRAHGVTRFFDGSAGNTITRATADEIAALEREADELEAKALGLGVRSVRVLGVKMAGGA